MRRINIQSKNAAVLDIFPRNIFFPEQLALKRISTTKIKIESFDDFQLIEAESRGCHFFHTLVAVKVFSGRWVAHWTVDQMRNFHYLVGSGNFFDLQRTKLINLKNNNLKFVYLNGILLSTFSAEFVTHLSGWTNLQFTNYFFGGFFRESV